MRVWIGMAALVACMFGSVNLVVAQAPAGGAPAAKTANRVALIDVGYIFKEHPTMKQRIEAIDSQMTNAQGEIETRRQGIMKEYESLKQFKEGSPEYRAKEEQIASMDSQLRLDFVRKEKEFNEAKARVLFESYSQVSQFVKAVAEYNGIDLVLRFSREEMDAKDPMSVQRGVVKEVIYHSPTLDLTDMVLDALRKQAPAATTANAQPGAAGVRK